MRGTKITITGGDEAHYLSASKESPRLIRFPDGVSRHITLPNWHWEVFDKLVKDKCWSKREFLKMVYEDAKIGITYADDFEKELRLAFRQFLKCAMAYVMKEEDWTIANQKFSTEKDNS